ncbi:MAG: hypothetical protein ACXABU_14355 [Candidatus Hodarchaeales archaeon]|jgi:hypothetical protein
MKLTEHIIVKVSDTKDSVLVETTPGITKLDASSLNKLIVTLKPFYFEINPLSRLLWQFMKDPQHELIERILVHFESDPTISERFQEHLIHLEIQINKKLSLFEAQEGNEDVPEEEEENSMKDWESKRQRLVQAKYQWIKNQKPEEVLSILAPNLSDF